MGTTTTLPGGIDLIPIIGEAVTYVLRNDEQIQYGKERVAANIVAISTPTCVDLSVVLGGKTLTLSHVTRGTTPGTWSPTPFPLTPLA